MREKRELLKAHIKANVAPMLIDFITGEDLEEAVVLQLNILKDKLNS